MPDKIRASRVGGGLPDQIRATRSGGRRLSHARRADVIRFARREKGGPGSDPRVGRACPGSDSRVAKRKGLPAQTRASCGLVYTRVRFARRAADISSARFACGGVAPRDRIADDFIDATGTYLARDIDVKQSSDRMGTQDGPVVAMIKRKLREEGEENPASRVRYSTIACGCEHKLAYPAFQAILADISERAGLYESAVSAPLASYSARYPTTVVRDVKHLVDQA
ncbi:hypothetical protein AB1Y20_008600 [Prymnesium parvum]|uniref:Uncharacterized protein n=1 Tax=Prymnesium parvum TaxID=97485 RepID=A0AB34IR84_PRYPA